MKHKRFDIILVYSFGRENLFYLSIIKYLSPKYKIGIFLSDDPNFYSKPENKTFAKVKETEKKIRKLFLQFGSEKIYANEKCECRLLLMYPFAYAEDYLQKIKTNISWDKLIGLFFHARGFRDLYILKELRANKYLMPAKFFIEMISKHETIDKELEGLEIIESGLPYKKYPIFDDLNLDIDYLVAMPSVFLLKRDMYKKRYDFFRTLIKALSNLQGSEKVYLKHHNVRDKQRYCPHHEGGMIFMKLGRLICELLIKLCPITRIKNKLYYICTMFMHNIIEKKYTSLEDLTEYHNLGIELFLPYVRKGIFTGLSGTIFHALFNKIAIYNCDPQEVKDDFAPFYRYFNIPCYKGDLSFDENNYNLIKDEVRNADLIALIEEEML